MAYILTLQLASGMSGKGITTDANIDSTIIKESTSNVYTQAELNAILFEMWQQGGGKLSIEYVNNVNNLPTPTVNTIGKLYLVPSENQEELNIKEEWITITSQTIVIGAQEVYQENDPDWDQSNDAILLGFVNGVCGYYVVDYQILGSFIPLKLGDTINDNSISKHYTVITRNGGPAWSGALDGIVSEPTTLYNWELIGSTQANLENYYTKSQIDTNFQSKLVSGTNVKTINGNSILGSGNIVINGNFELIVDVDTNNNFPTASANTMNKIYLRNSSSSDTNNVKEEWITISYHAVTYNNKEYKVVNKGTADGWYDDAPTPGTDGEIRLHGIGDFVYASWDSNGIAHDQDLVEEWSDELGYWNAIDVRLGDSYTIGNDTFVATTSGWSDPLIIPLVYKWEQIGKQIQSDWNQNNSSANDYIKNKPTIPTVPSNETAISGGSTLSVVTTGEKYTWNNKANIWRGTQAQYDLLTPDNNTIYIITATS